MNKKRLILGFVLICLVFYAGTAAAESASPILPVYQWLGKSVNLENLKGHLTVVVFFNDDDG